MEVEHRLTLCYTLNRSVRKIGSYGGSLRMKWYIDMTEKDKHDFWKVIIVCVLGAISVLLVPIESPEKFV